MGNKAISFWVIIFVLAAVGYPLWIGLKGIDWSSGSVLQNIFPLFGLVAVSLLWVHSISGVLEPWMRKHMDFDLFVSITATIILFCIVLHPLLLFINLGIKTIGILLSFQLYIWLGIIAWFLLMTYDIGKLLKYIGYNYFAQHWNAILIISNTGFLLIFFHSLALGRNLQSGPLRTVWIFYGITAALALAYTYAVRPLLNIKNTENEKL